MEDLIVKCRIKLLRNVGIRGGWVKSQTGAGTGQFKSFDLLFCINHFITIIVLQSLQELGLHTRYVHFTYLNHNILQEMRESREQMNEEMRERMEESYIEEKEMQLNLKPRHKGPSHHRPLARTQSSPLVLSIPPPEPQEPTPISYRYTTGERPAHFTLVVSDFNCKHAVIKIWCNYRYKHLEKIHIRCQ